jgi:hypothetical protein
LDSAGKDPPELKSCVFLKKVEEPPSHIRESLIPQEILALIEKKCEMKKA